jgi:hypothetical protein
MSIESIINSLDVRKIKAPSGLTYEQELIKAADQLSVYIENEIHRGSLANSLSTEDIADIQVVNGNSLSVTLKVQNSIRPSIFKKWNQSDANVFWLLNDGYTVKKDVWFKNIPNFGYRVAEHFVENGIKKFNQNNSLGIKVEVIRPLLYYGSIT